MKRLLARPVFLAYAIVMGVVLSGCSPVTSASVFPEGGFAVEVPVLWFSAADDGGQTGGVESTQVWTGASHESGYAVDLSGVKATGAGDSWRAASASAAAVATLINGVDPSSIDIQFRISSPIDGPSAGGILTVGILASMRQIPLKSHATMTGTISPDGSIGPVGGVFSKVSAAADAGFTTVVIPVSNKTSRNPVTMVAEDMVAYGATRGVSVVPVAQVSEAFSALTGEPLQQASTVLGVPAGSAVLDGQRALNVADLLNKTQEILVATPSNEASTLVQETRAAIARGENDLASGVAREAYLAAWRQAVEAQTRQAAAPGVGNGVAFLALRVDSALTRSHDAIAAVAGRSGLTDSQFASMPEMLLGVVTAEATLEPLKEALSGVVAEPELLRAANILADQEAAIDVFLPLDVNLLMLVKGSKKIASENPVAFLSNYTNFLISSGEANMTYLHSVLGATTEAGVPAIASFETSYPMLVSLAAKTQLINVATDSLSEELRQAAEALTLYVSSAALVTEAQALGLFNSGIGQSGDLSENAAATSASIENALVTVEEAAVVVAAQGWDAGYAFAEAQAGAAFAHHQRDQTSSTDSVARGLHRLWAASVAVQLMKAAPA